MLGLARAKIQNQIADSERNDGGQACRRDWSVIIPFHNEAAYLRRCLESLARQTEPFEVILVDNASTDGSGLLAQRLCVELGIPAQHMVEMRPGKVAALQCGLAQVRSDYVATCDADTIYPANYLEIAGKLLRNPACVAAVAATARPHASSFAVRTSGMRLWLTSLLLPQQCLNGGAGQVFRTAQLRHCGGFDPAIWNWVLEDHEVMARIEQHGRIAYAPGFCCHPSERPKAVDCRGWRLAEQVRYHLSARWNRIAFFHEFLGPRLCERALSSDQLRGRLQIANA